VEFIARTLINRDSMKRLAAKRSALLSLIFLVVYGACNWIAAHHPDVGMWYFAWERRIPFVPVMIVPYLSVDALFVAAPFLCRDRGELNVFTRRVIVAILAAGACFLAMPLEFSFVRPEVQGWPGVLFDVFSWFDRPFNLFPSLHIALTCILADTYLRNTKSVVRAALAIWFVLVGLSTLFTYQHHVIDIAGGLALAALIFYYVQGERTDQSSVSNRRIAI
jgi:membrane-associated phospholipid phosphatase